MARSHDVPILLHPPIEVASIPESIPLAGVPSGLMVHRTPPFSFRPEPAIALRSEQQLPVAKQFQPMADKQQWPANSSEQARKVAGANRVVDPSEVDIAKHTELPQLQGSGARQRC